jgi:quercetin dioxygenase-like cupin family protein
MEVAMAAIPYPEFITRLPRVQAPKRGVQGWLSQARDHQVVFFEIEPIGEIPPHSHGEQWGIVVEGEMELTIAGMTQRYGPGDSYQIPAGVEHSARFLTHFRAIDVFADADRYQSESNSH